MAKMVLRGMAERKRGAIVNISSVSGTSPMSLLTVYSATKVYVKICRNYALPVHLCTKTHPICCAVYMIVYAGVLVCIV